ncbi:MAG: 30S ribosomal protein S20 [Alphaproteobacteria bacterium]
MADHPSALKRARQALRRNERNRARLSATRSAVKKVEAALDAKDAAAAEAALKLAEPALARTARKGVMKRKTASRKVSRLAKRIKTLKK